MLQYLGFLFDISEKTIINKNLEFISKNLVHETAREGFKMKKFAATNSVIPDRIKKRMSSRRVSPLAMGVNPLLLLKETEERDQPREAKRSWENATQKALYDRADD